MTFLVIKRVTGNTKIGYGLMLIPGFTVLISIKHIFAEHRYVLIFNTKNHIRGGRYEGIKSVNSFTLIGRVWFFLQGFL
jgi:hypothetical protein